MNGGQRPASPESSDHYDGRGCMLLRQSEGHCQSQFRLGGGRTNAVRVAKFAPARNLRRGTPACASALWIVFFVAQICLASKPFKAAVNASLR